MLAANGTIFFSFYYYNNNNYYYDYNRSLSAVKEHLMSGGVDVIKIMESIRSIIVKTIMSVQPFISAKFNEQVPFR